jgi:biopolymer transport protein ExbB/TolQ
MFNDMGLAGMISKGGVTIYILIFCSVLSLTVFLERLKTFSGVRLKTLEQIKSKVVQLVMSGKISEAVSFCENYSEKWLFLSTGSPLAEVYKTILFSLKKNKEDLTDVSIRTIDKEIIQLEKYLGILGTIGNIALYIGLFGTILGIMHAFQSLALQAAAGPSVVASGIAEALINTAGGLFVAVPAVIFYNYFTRNTRKVLIYLEDSASELIDILKK